ncbi:hypothetical protein DPMN_191930 [Dreissena polymorpha]|uniref:Uncharacterized protein n=1 Tax=Dreissena polymorpha TaxID=45954 RepID=A0A9D3Y281_DREPO|nr:hypothetical protein DPMN_191930 [Dreissena polymorpha]
MAGTQYVSTMSILWLTMMTMLQNSAALLHVLTGTDDSGLMMSAAGPKTMAPPAFNRLRSFFVGLQQDSGRLRQDVIKKVFSNNRDFRSSSDRASLATSQDTWLESAHTSNEASSHNSPLLACPVTQELQHRPPLQT